MRFALQCRAANINKLPTAAVGYRSGPQAALVCCACEDPFLRDVQPSVQVKRKVRSSAELRVAMPNLAQVD